MCSVPRGGYNICGFESEQSIMPRPTSRALLERLEERIAPATFTVTNVADGGIGPLRQAILDANAAEGPDAIDFSCPDGGVHTIALASALPVITETLSVTAPAWEHATPPVVALDGSQAGAADGLVIVADD